MSKNKSEKRFWEKFYGISLEQAKQLDPHTNGINFRETNLDDEGLGYLLNRFKRIGFLDLDYTDISDDGAEHFLKLEYVKELRLKGCREITARSTPVLSKLPGLELLHLAGTGISLDDIDGLSGSSSLKELYLSSDDSEAEIINKVSRLKQLLPGVKFIVNYKIVG